MKKLREDKALETKDERLIHADSGEGGQLDLSPDKEKIDKEVTKELKDRVKYVEDEINDAETPKPEATTGDGKKKGVEGLTKPVRKLKEKLILEEPSDMLSERLILDEDDTIKVYHKNSNLTEVSVNEALDLVKRGQGKNVRMLIGEQLVRLNDTRTPTKQLFTIADKVYVTKDQNLLGRNR